MSSQSSLPIDRRSMLTSSLAAGAAAWIASRSPLSEALGSLALGSATASRNDDSFARIDTHQHLWDLSKFNLPWTSGNERLERNYLIPEYRQAIEGTGIETAVYMEVGMEKSLQTAEAEWLVELCADASSGTVAGVIAGQPFEPEFAAYAKRFAAHDCIKGIRHLLQIPESPEGTCRTAEYRAGVQLLGELGLRFDLCIRPGELDDAFELAKSCPETRFVLDHCGNADPVAFVAADRRKREAQHDGDAWRRSIERLASLDNVICKISGIIARVDPEAWSPEDLAPIVLHCLAAFGEDRVMFASDWPVCTLGAPLAKWVEALDWIVSDRPLEFRKKLYRDNALRFYGLNT